MRCYVAAKLHGIQVTGKAVEYHGSVSVCPHLLRAAGIEPYEQVHVVNLSTGARWVTYALEGDPGAFTLNGGGARMGEVSDRCVLMTFAFSPRFPGAWAVMVGPGNVPVERLRYGPEGET